MYKKLRIIFTILSALCAAVALPIGAFLGFIGAILFALGAFLFYMIMLLFKQKQEAQESAVSTKETDAPEKKDNE